jgi:hypothetical protein
MEQAMAQVKLDSAVLGSLNGPGPLFLLLQANS